MNLHRLLPIVALVSLPASVAFAQQQSRPAPAPATMLLIGTDIYSNGSSSNFPNALRQFIDETYTVGACQESDGWAKCDEILWGMSMYPGSDCSDTGADGPVAWMYATGEDVGADIKTRLNNIHTERGSTYCGGGGYDGDNCANDDDCQGDCDKPGTNRCINSGTVDLINNDTAYERTWENQFPDTVNASDEDLDDYWERPHVNFTLVENFPQGMYGDDENRLLGTLVQTCKQLKGGFLFDGRACSADTECISGLAGDPCRSPFDCVGGECDMAMGTCVGNGTGADGDACASNGDCAGSQCDQTSLTCKGDGTMVHKDVCKTDGDCQAATVCDKADVTDEEGVCTKLPYGKTCECLDIHCQTGRQCAETGILPSNPTWVMTERKTNEDEAVFGGLIAAAGGTGRCEEKVSGNNWVELDVCDDYLKRGSTTSDSIRDDIADGDVRCGPGDEQSETGALDFGNSTGTLSEIQCHLYGTIANNQCSNIPDTDLVGLFQCIRQLPRGVSAEDGIVQFCADGFNTNEDVFDEECVTLTEARGEIEFIDERRTLFLIVSGDGAEGTACSQHQDCIGLCVDGLCDGTDKCEGGDTRVFECPTELDCDTGQPGRCAAGEVLCTDGDIFCVPKNGAFPEICNGLDDDCDGDVDNMKESWAKPQYQDPLYDPLPADHEGLHCNKLNLCTCPEGATDVHSGTDWDTFLDGWNGICECGESLSPTAPTGPETDSFGDSQATCAAVGDDAIPASLLALILLGFVQLTPRRWRPWRRR